jgi:phospho-N-acetylmuramoyl-pentapeptide-transferase
VLLKLLYPLVKVAGVFNVFQYVTFRAAYAAITALLIAFLLGPAVIRWLRALKVGQVIRNDGPETHLSKAGTPTMGGLLMLLSIVVAVVLWQDPANPYTWIVIGATLGFGGIGFVDDWLKIRRKSSGGLRGVLKLGAQFALSAAVVLALYAHRNAQTTLLYLPLVKLPVVDLGLWYLPLAALLLVGYSNAVNITDGQDGLATGLVIMVGITLGALAYVTGRADWAEYLLVPHIGQAAELTVFSLALAGAAVGFLWFNSHPAEVMMGDTGSLALGGAIGTVALMIKKEVLLFVIGGVFVIEIASVVIQVAHFKLTGRRVFRMAPLHHHFEKAGWAEQKVVTRLWILGGLFAILALSTLKLQ